jgi:crotonobetainyl-CoA:carnitine CoA-transferase CaiB-like acyl-CoA transferase
MGGQLEGMVVAVDARDRRVLLAASWLAELGATVHVVGEMLDDGADRDLDRAWVGAGGVVGGAGVAGAPLAGTEVDLVILARGTDGLAVHDGPARCTVTLHGTPPDGPLAGCDVDERALAARAGLAVAIGMPDRDPLPMPEGVLDTMVAMHLVSAGLAGILEGARAAEVVATDAIAHAVIMNSNLFVPFGRPWHRAGTRASQSGGVYPYAILSATDGQVVLIGRTDADWHNLVAAAGDPAWARDPRFSDPVVSGRDHADELDALFMDAWLSHRTREQVLRDAEQHRFAAGPVLTPLEVLEDPILAPLWRTTTVRGREVLTPGAPFRTRRNGPGGRSDRPLSGCLVLDLSWVWSGPGAGAAMADLGATVVKVESRTRPDNTRLRRGLPQGRVAEDAPQTEISPYFHGMNRGKRSITLNVKEPGGRALLEALSERADVILENFTPGVMTRAGIDADQVAARNPGCVHVSMRGYSDHPSTRELRGYAPVMSARAGIEHLIAYPDGTRTGAMTYGHSDASAVAQALTLMLAGLWARRRHGTGSSATLFQNEGVVWANGHNLIAAQLGVERPLEPIPSAQAITFEELDGSDAVSTGMLRRLPHRWLGEVVASALPFRLDGVRPAPTVAGPEMGEHTHEVLRDVLGLDDATIARHELEGSLE